MTRLTWFFIISLFSFQFNLSLAQSSDYIVDTQTLSLRVKPGKGHEVVHIINGGESVIVLKKLKSGWWQVRHRDAVGYVMGSYLSTSDASRYKGWGTTSLKSGDKPDCFKFSPVYNKEIDNNLKITVGPNTDVVIKLMKKRTNECIRYVYIRSRDVVYIRNIPQGVYYLKVAYGRDWRQKVIDGKCFCKFMQNAQFEKSKETFDFRIVMTDDDYQIPSYEISLDVINGRTPWSNRISEKEFNK